LIGMLEITTVLLRRFYCALLQGFQVTMPLDVPSLAVLQAFDVNVVD